MHRHVLHPGDRLVPIAVMSLGGGAATILPSGRAQVINVFATWCPPCRAETPAFAVLASRLQRRGVDVVGIDQEEASTQVARFAQEFALPYPVYIDRSGMTHDVLGARMIPTTIYIDAGGIIRWEHAGPMSAQDFTELSNVARSAG